MDPPLPASTMALPNTWQARKTLRKSTSRMRSHSASSISKNGVPELMPAAFKTISTPPKLANVASSTRWISAFRVTSAWHARALAPLIADRPGMPLRTVLVQIGNHDIRARSGQSHGDLAREHSSPADNHRGLPRQREEILNQRYGLPHRCHSRFELELQQPSWTRYTTSSYSSSSSRVSFTRPLPLSFSSNGCQQCSQMSNSFPSISFLETLGRRTAQVTTHHRLPPGSTTREYNRIRI